MEEYATVYQLKSNVDYLVEHLVGGISTTSLVSSTNDFNCRVCFVPVNGCSTLAIVDNQLFFRIHLQMTLPELDKQYPYFINIFITGCINAEKSLLVIHSKNMQHTSLCLQLLSKVVNQQDTVDCVLQEAA
ncbi:hypothetical protein KCM76_23360 [Zooshikella marina]|uniref:hypothetical protein n=1 Tax=Zooshikella ganghwensis TaxID=202772 RepID=UPI001BAF9A85|nr:hypothetical protein [Zooshikella ganghwensis]MBU2708953.1 hypothetical protein [Zooshikella ganghwensis]